MVLAVVFTLLICALGLLSLAPAKLIGIPYGLIASAAVFFPGIFVCISICSDLDEGRLRSMPDLKASFLAGLGLFKGWAIYTTCSMAVAFAVAAFFAFQ